MGLTSWTSARFDPAEAGGKAASLASLAASGFDVPAGFVVPASVYAEAVEPLASELRSRLERAGSDHEALSDIERWMRERLATSPVVSRLELELDEAYSALGAPSVAVRSSATAEDLAEASFAGQYDTRLRVGGVGEIVDAMLDVWASLHSPRAVRYRDEHSIDGDVAMGVIVQELVPASHSGVIFTRDPVTGDDRIVVTVAAGLGDGLVAGTAPSDTYFVDATRAGIVERDLAAGEPMLDAATVEALADTARRVAAALGGDREIEFAIAADGRVRLLQARPITTIGGEGDFAVRWTGPGDADRSWRLRSPAPATRLELDVHAALAARMESGFAETGSPMMLNHLWCVQNGYLYTAAPDVDQEEVSRLRQALDDLAEGYAASGTSLYHAEVEPLLLERLDELASLRHAQTLSGMLRYMKAGIEAYADAMGNLHWRMRTAEVDWPATYEELTGRPRDEAEVMLQALTNRTTELIAQLRGLARIVQDDETLREIFEARDWSRLSGPDLHGSTNAVRFREALESLMGTHGLRTGMGLGSVANYFSPTWEMDPSIPLGMVASYVRQDLDELDERDARLAEQRLSLHAEIRRDLADDPGRLERFELAHARVANAARTTEDHNHLMEQACGGSMRDSIWRLGRSLVEAGELDDPDDVFHLSVEELEARVEGAAVALRAVVVERKRQIARWDAVRAPRQLGAEAGPDPMMARFQPPEGAGLDGEVLRGVSASRGRAVGPARVAQAALAPPDVESGEVLVASMVGDAWAPIFPLLAGLVLDYGGVSQHAAVVAREYGVPAVFMTKEATTAIVDGQIVTVNGDEGYVALFDEHGGT